MSTPIILLLKSLVAGYTRKDGTYVKPHSRKGGPAAKPGAGQLSLFAKQAEPAKLNPFKGKDPVKDTLPLFDDEPVHTAPKKQVDDIRTSMEKFRDAARDKGDHEQAEYWQGEIDKKAAREKRSAELHAQFKQRGHGFELKHGSRDSWAVLLPDASNPGKYRYQMYDKDGFSAHSTHDTPEKALDDAITAGYTQPDVGALERLSNDVAWQRGMELSAVIQAMNSKQISWEEGNKRAAEIVERYADKKSGDDADSSLLSDIPGAKWKRGKGMINGHYGVEVDGDVVGNYHVKPEDAAAEAKRMLADRADHAKKQAETRGAKDKLADRLKSGGEVSDADLALLSLRDGSSDLRWFIPAAADLFGISSRAVRPHIADMIRVGHTDMGAKREYVSPKKALAAIGAGLGGGAKPEPRVLLTKPAKDLDGLIKIAADSIEKLRKDDVYRVLDQNADSRDALAQYISQKRPDLAQEVSDVMREEFGV